MKYLYIEGLEHSGSTLLALLLSYRADVTALGEVGQWFSPQYMERYINLWGEFPDARICSCGKEWDECEFWGNLIHLCGLNGDTALSRKYSELVDYCRSDFPPKHVFVDTSKRSEWVSVVADAIRTSDGGECISLWMVKDVRSFAASIRRKSDSPSFLRTLKTFNWWLAVNREAAGRFRNAGGPQYLVLYENLALDTTRELDRIGRSIGLSRDLTHSAKHQMSHIVLGNKDFLTRNRDAIKYDNQWFMDETVGWAYLLHAPVRRLNSWLYRTAGADTQG